MTSFFLILSMVSLVFLIIGLVNPGLVIFRGRKRRFLVITIYGSIALLSLFLLILLAPPSRNQANVALVQTPLPAGQGGNGASSPPGSTASPQPALESGPLMNEPIHYPSEFTEISTTMVTWFEGTLNIVGETDLPDGAVIEAMVRPMGSTMNPNPSEIKAETTVKHHDFQFMFTPSVPDELSQGLFQIRTVFSLEKQSPHIQQVVGLYGEKLKGKKAHQEGSIRTLEDIQEVSFQFEIAPTPAA